MTKQGTLTGAGVPAINKPKVHRIKDVYKEYAKALLENNKEYWKLFDAASRTHTVYTKKGNKVITVTSYKIFQAIMNRFMERTRHHVIEGGRLNLGNNLGSIMIRRVERDHSKKMINHKETKKQPRDPVTGRRERIIYFTGDDWCRITWKRSRKIANDSLYRFNPTAKDGDGRGTGFKPQLSTALNTNPLLKYRYPFFPYITETSNKSRKSKKN